MHAVFYLLVFARGTGTLYAQKSETFYYKKVDLKDRVSKKQANFSFIRTQHQDGTETREVWDLKKDKLKYSETLKGEEPFGIWYYENEKGYDTLNYDFELSYSSQNCKGDSIRIPANIFQDSDSLLYVAPKLSGGETSLLRCIVKNIFYPHRAREEGIQGRVFLSFLISEQGTIENIHILKGAHILLDKEAARVLRLVRFKNPAMSKGKAAKICFNLPVSFKLQ